MLKTKQRIIASIVSFSMLFSLVGPNLVFATGDETEPTITVETTLPSDDTDETTIPADETTSSSEETTESEEPAESKETEAPSESTSESTEETADPTDETTVETEESTEAPTEPTTEEKKEPSEPKETEPKETKPEETEPPKRGAAKGPTRGEVEVQPGGVSNTAEAGLDACAMLYYASSTDTDHYVLEIQEGNQDKSTSYGEFIKSYVIGTDDIPWNEDYNDATGELYKTNIIRVNYRQNFTGRTSLSHFYDGFTNLTQITNYDTLLINWAPMFFVGCVLAWVTTFLVAVK